MTPREKDEAHQELLKAIRDKNQTHLSYWIYQGAKPERNNWQALRVAYEKGAADCLKTLVENCQEKPPAAFIFSLLEQTPPPAPPENIQNLIRLLKDTRDIEEFLKKNKKPAREIPPGVLKLLQLQHELLYSLEKGRKGLDL